MRRALQPGLITMKRKLFAGLVLALVLVTSATYYASWQKDNPVVLGKRLTVWLEQLSASQPGDVAHRQAEVAIQTLATNALPALASLWHISRFDLWKMQMVNRFSDEPRHATMPLPAAEHRIQLAERGFRALGRTAIPTLSEWLCDPGTSELAAMILIDIQPEGYALVMPALTNKHARVRAAGVSMAIRAGTNAPVILPKLIELLNDPDWTVRVFAARSLGELRLQKDQVIPALLKSQPDPNLLANTAKAGALKKFGVNPATVSNAEPKDLTIPDKAFLQRYHK